MSDDPFDGWTIEVERTVPADIAAVWAVVSDPLRVPELSSECVETAWVDEGTTFDGTNARGDVRWTVRCHVLESVAPTTFAWTVLDPAAPSSTWRYELTAVDGGTRVAQSFVHGPGPSGPRMITADKPEMVDEVKAGRGAELAAHMGEGLDRVATLLA